MLASCLFKIHSPSAGGRVGNDDERPDVRYGAWQGPALAPPTAPGSAPACDAAQPAAADLPPALPSAASPPHCMPPMLYTPMQGEQQAQHATRNHYRQIWLVLAPLNGTKQ